MKFIPLILFTLLSVSLAHAKTTLPRQLTDSDRNKVTQVLGFGSMMKLLSNPYPLGGYDGVELGLSSQYIPMDDIARLGDKTGDEGEFNYYTLSVGKGLFHNIDVFVEFTPMPQAESLSTFAAQVRWGFYEASFFPFSLSAVMTGGGSSYSSLINSTTLGADLVGAVTMKDVALYFGVGRARAVTTFIGGGNGITDDQQNHKLNLLASHVLFGVQLEVSKFFLALEMDRFVETMYSGKVGLRF